MFKSIQIIIFCRDKTFKLLKYLELSRNIDQTKTKICLLKQISYNFTIDLFKIKHSLLLETIDLIRW